MQSNLSGEKESATRCHRFGSESQTEVCVNDNLHSRSNNEIRIQKVSEWTTENGSVTLQNVENSADETDCESSVVDSCDENESDSSIVESLNSNEKARGNPLRVESSFGNIAIENGSDTLIGSKTIYYGPVTIKQVVAKPNVYEQTVGVVNDNEMKVSEILNRIGEYIGTRPLNISVTKSPTKYFFTSSCENRDHGIIENRFKKGMVCTRAFA